MEAIGGILGGVSKLITSLWPLFRAVGIFVCGGLVTEFKQMSDYYEEQAKSSKKALEVQQKASSLPVAGAADRLRDSPFNRDRVL